MSLFLKYFNLRERLRSLFRRGEHGIDGVNVAALLGDLRDFCCYGRSTVVVNKQGVYDPLATAHNEGKREVYLRIIANLDLSDEALNKLKELEE